VQAAVAFNRRKFADGLIGYTAGKSAVERCKQQYRSLLEVRGWYECGIAGDEPGAPSGLFRKKSEPSGSDFQHSKRNFEAGAHITAC